MAKPSKCFLKRNKTTREFRNLYAKLPSNIKQIARKAAVAFDAGPDHAGFRLHKLRDNSVGSHKPESFSVSFALSYRASSCSVKSRTRIASGFGTGSERTQTMIASVGAEPALYELWPAD